MPGQVHFPFPTFPQSILADALTEIMEKGLVKAVGVCNYNVQQLSELQSILGKRGIPLASNQVSPLDFMQILPACYPVPCLCFLCSPFSTFKLVLLSADTDCPDCATTQEEGL